MTPPAATAHRRPAAPVAALLLAALALLAAACASTTEAPFASGATTTAPAAQSGPASTAKDPACNDERADASYTPPATQPTPGQMPAGSYMATIKNRKFLVAGVGADTLLFGFLNPKTGNLEGFDVEIARLVAKAIFGPDYTEQSLRLVPLTSAERIPRLTTPVDPANPSSGGVDLVVKTMTINCARWAQIAFSTKYYESGQQLLVSTTSDVTGIDQAAGRTICAVSGTTSLDNIKAKGVKVVEEADWTDCLVAFQQGRADGISTDDTILAGLAAQDPNARIVGEKFTAEPYGIGLPKDEQDFTRFVNGVLQQARADGTWQRIYDQLLASTLGPQSPPRAVYR